MKKILENCVLPLASYLAVLAGRPGHWTVFHKPLHPPSPEAGCLLDLDLVNILKSSERYKTL